jgi:hypothetical protein
MYGMKEGSEAKFGKGYNVLPIFKDRLDAKTLITTPNSDVIYALGYLDLKEDGPLVIEAPPGLQGIIDDFRQRPIPWAKSTVGNEPATQVNILYPHDFSAFEMIDRYIQHEYEDPMDFEFRGMIQSLGVEKGKPFRPDASTKQLLEYAAQAAWRMGQVLTRRRPKYYKDRQWLQPLPTDGAREFTHDTYTDIGWRTAMFTMEYSNSPAMFLNMVDIGAKYPLTMTDADGDALDGVRTISFDCRPASRRSKLQAE